MLMALSSTHDQIVVCRKSSCNPLAARRRGEERVEFVRLDRVRFEFNKGIGTIQGIPDLWVAQLAGLISA